MMYYITKENIAELRGGRPDKCDFCLANKPFEELEPEESGMWVCHECLERWDKAKDEQEDGA